MALSDTDCSSQKSSTSCLLPPIKKYLLVKTNYGRYISEFRKLMDSSVNIQVSSESMVYQTSRTSYKLQDQSDIVERIIERTLDQIRIVFTFHELIMTNNKNSDFIQLLITITELKTNVETYASMNNTEINDELKQFVEYYYEILFNHKKILDYITNHLNRNLKPCINDFMRILMRTVRETKIEDETIQKYSLRIQQHRKITSNVRDNLKRQEEFYIEELADKRCYIKQLFEKIEDTNANLLKEFESLSISSKDQLATMRKSSQERISVLQMTLKTLKEQLAGLRYKDKCDEDQIRQQKYKLESQLCEWIRKYDLDVGQRQIELDRLNDVYDRALSEHNELECIVTEHATMYHAYISERNAEEEHIFQAKLNALRAERAAKIIQRTWREYRARQKRKKRKGRKSKAKSK